MVTPYWNNKEFQIFLDIVILQRLLMWRGPKAVTYQDYRKIETMKTLFRHFFPLDAVQEEIDKTNQRSIIYDFLRRTGDLIIQSDYYWNLHDDPKTQLQKWRETVLQSLLEGASNTIQKSLSKLQAKAIASGANRRAVILHGVPGSGKTYGGIERILFRQRSVFSQTGEGTNCGIDKAIGNEY